MSSFFPFMYALKKAKIVSKLNSLIVNSSYSLRKDSLFKE